MRFFKYLIKKITCLVKGIGEYKKGAYVALSAELLSPEKISLGEGVSIEPHARLYANGDSARIHIDDNTTVYPYALLKCNGGRIEIGKSSSVHDYCVLDGTGGIRIGGDVHIAAHTIMVAAEHDYNKLGRPDFSLDVPGRGIVIKDSVWIGVRVVILDGVTIGEGAVVGAGAVVTKDIPPYTVCVGAPARVIKNRVRPA